MALSPYAALDSSEVQRGHLNFVSDVVFDVDIYLILEMVVFNEKLISFLRHLVKQLHEFYLLLLKLLYLLLLLLHLALNLRCVVVVTIPNEFLDLH